MASNEVKGFIMEYDRIIAEFTDLCRDCFGGKLAGVYLHGSAAMGCFNPKKSDLDLIVVVESALSDEEKLSFLHGVAALNGLAPEKGIETSAVLRRVCRPFLYPTPYELHFSPAYLGLYRRDPIEYIERLCGVDRDLAAHFTIINHFGIALYGAPVGEIFGAVPPECYRDSILYDIQDARAAIVSSPVYVTLNLCRVLAFLEAGLVTSKKTGGEWARDRIPTEYGDIVSRALLSYAGDGEMPAAEAELSSFAEYMLARINEK